MFVVFVCDRGFCYSCDSGVVKSAGCCSAAGRARSESAVPALCSGFLWADGCADSDYCEVSFSFLPLVLSAVPVFLSSYCCWLLLIS